MLCKPLRQMEIEHLGGIQLFPMVGMKDGWAQPVDAPAFPQRKLRSCVTPNPPFEPFGSCFHPRIGAEIATSPPWGAAEPPDPLRLSHPSCQHSPHKALAGGCFWGLFIFNFIKTKPLCCPSHEGASEGVDFGVEQQIAGLLYKRWMLSQQKARLGLLSQPQWTCQVLLSFNLCIDPSGAQIGGGKKGMGEQGVNVKCRNCFCAGSAEIPGQGAAVNPFGCEMDPTHKYLYLI